MLRKLKRGCRSCSKAVRQAMGCEKTYNENAEIFSASDSDAESVDESNDAQALREIDLLRPDLNAARDFPSNAIRTARYTLLTAIPFSLLYQFHKVSNIFFLLVAVVALVPGASPINPFSSLVPLIIVVGAGVLKDLWEDSKRRSADKEANSTRVYVLRDGEFAAVKSSDVLVGDVMLYRLGEEVRADCLILNTSLPDGLTYIETANLDGETNAKTRRAKVQTVQQMGTVEDIEALAFSRNDGVRCYSEAMAARPRMGMCTRFCGSYQPSAAEVQCDSAVDRAESACGLGGKTGGTAAGVLQRSRGRTSSGCTDFEDVGQIKVGFVDSETKYGLVCPDDGIEDERAHARQVRVRDPPASPSPPRQRAGPGENPLGDGATTTMKVSADELRDDALFVGDVAADDAARNALLRARVGTSGGDGLADHVVTPSSAVVNGGVHILVSGLNPDLASWFGQLRLPSGEVVAVTIDQFLPRGCTVRNTEWVLAVVIYTGRHTKMMLNLRPKPNKTTVLSQRLNQMNLFLLIFFLTMMVLVCCLGVREKHRMLKKTDGVRTTYSTWYIQYHLERHGDGTLFWWRFLTNFVLLSYLIPLSLYVTLEFNKAMQMLMIGADNRMAVFDAFSGKLKHARPKTSELNNQLAQVQYIFTDKTGTLTENLMTYVGGYAAGNSHDERAKPGGLGKVFLTEVIPRLLERTRVLKMDRDETTTSSSSRDDVQHATSGAVSAAAASAAVAAALSRHPSSPDIPRAALTRAGGDAREEATHDVIAHTHLTKVSEAARHDPRLAHKHSDVPYLDEGVLENDALYRYLRALALCHSVVCFKAPLAEEEEDGHQDEGDVETASLSHGARGGGNASKGASDKKKDKRERHATKKSKNGSLALTAEETQEAAQGRAKAAKCRRRRELENEWASHCKAMVTLDAMTPRADGSRVFIPSAVPIDDTYEDLLVSTQRTRHPFEPCRSGPTATGDANDHHGPFAGQNPTRPTSQLCHSRTLSAVAMGSTGDPAALSHSGLAAPLHGRTGSTGWYYARLHAHSRNATNVSATLGASGTAAMLAATASANPLEKYVDRTKIYEGQSLDEIALVSAARENGFSLYERTAKQLFVSVLGHIVCYDIIAELEFTPQRKLMSILVRRNPDGDSVEVATAASAASNTHYHKDKTSTTSTESSTHAQTTTATEEPCPTSGEAARTGGEVASRGGGEDDAKRRASSRTPSSASVRPRCPSTGTLVPSLDADSHNETEGSPMTRAMTADPNAHLHESRRDSASAQTHTHVPESVFGHDDSHNHNTYNRGSVIETRQAHNGSHGDAKDARRRRTPSPHAEVSGASFPNTTQSEFPYLLLVKGADSAMLDIVNLDNPANSVLREPLMADLDEMSKTGLRTLILGQRIVPAREVNAWLPIFNEASCAMAQRSERLHEAYAMLERDVDLIGTTAVEDKLQEGVPDTLEFFSKAGIIVWMLTGDKRETAVTIAQTSGLVARGFADALCHLDITDLLLEEAAIQHQRLHKEDATTDGAGTQAGDGGELMETPTTGADSHTVDTSAEQAGRRTQLQAIRQRMVERMNTQLEAAEEQCRQSKATHGASQCVLVVDGKTLDFIFSDARRSRRFFDLGGTCRSAVCCRMTPLQKSSIVRMFQRNTKAVALAVGDGANDVSMIQEARIGIGVMGLEGSQAELASDYAIPKFRFLKRLLFVHGRFSQYRDAHCILYSLYKNVLLTTGLCVYMFYCGFSGLSFIDSWLLAMFSVFFCSLQPLMIGILDKDVEDELAETLPDIYPPMARENMYFSLPYIVKWLLDGLVEGLLFFFFVYYTTAEKEDLYRSGLMGGVEDYGQVFFTMMCLVCDLRVAVIISYYMILFLVAVIVEIAMIPICQIVYAHINNLAGSNWCVLIADNLYASGKFWLFLFASCGVLAVYTMATNLYVQMFHPWINAGPAMNAMRASPYRHEHDLEKTELMREYTQRLATQKRREQAALTELEKKMRDSTSTED